MTDAEMKIQLIRLIDNQSGQTLMDLYETLQNRLNQYIKTDLSVIESGYKAMSKDIKREKEASEWIENTLNLED